MAKTTREIDITPHPSLVSKLGATGYRTYEAIAELIDNSIDAKLDSQLLKIKVKLDIRNKTIIVEDNGRGMDFETLKNAMTLAYVEKDKRDKLGVYGLGMKTACSSLGENFYTRTKPIGENKIYECSYKEKEWINGEKNKWTTFPIDVKEDTVSTHGTSIKIEKLKVSLYSNLIGKFRKIFGIRYGPFLKSELLELWVNTLKCKSETPDIIAETKREFNLKLRSGNTISGWGALLKRRRGVNFGFNLYKNGRLIRMFDKSLLGREAHSAISRVIGELDLDHVPTLYNKTDFLRESNEFEEVAAIFPEYEKFKDLKRDALQPIYAKELSELTKEKIKDITLNLLKQVGDIEKNNYVFDFPQKFKKGRGEKILDYDLNLLGKKEKVVIKLVYFDNISLKEIKLEKPTEILINQNSPAYLLAKNKTSFINSQIAESIAYIIAKRKNLSIKDFLESSNKFVNASIMETKKHDVKRRTKDRKKENEKMLLEELREVNTFLKKEFGDEAFYFTATSLLEKYLTHIPRSSYYFIYCDQGLGEDVRDKLIDKFKDKFLIVLRPSKPKKLDLDYLENLIENTGVTKIIIIREKEREKTYRREGSVAPLEIALVDLVFETEKNKLPIFSSDIDEMIYDLESDEKLDKKRLRRYATQRGYPNFLKEKFGG